MFLHSRAIKSRRVKKWRSFAPFPLTEIAFFLTVHAAKIGLTCAPQKVFSPIYAILGLLFRYKRYNKRRWTDGVRQYSNRV